MSNVLGKLARGVLADAVDVPSLKLTIFDTDLPTKSVYMNYNSTTNEAWRSNKIFDKDFPENIHKIKKDQNNQSNESITNSAQSDNSLCTLTSGEPSDVQGSPSLTADNGDPDGGSSPSGSSSSSSSSCSGSSDDLPEMPSTFTLLFRLLQCLKMVTWNCQTIFGSMFNPSTLRK